MSKGLNMVIEGIKFIVFWIMIGIIATPVMLWLLSLFVKHFYGYTLV